MPPWLYLHRKHTQTACGILTGDIRLVQSVWCSVPIQRHYRLAHILPIRRNLINGDFSISWPDVIATMADLCQPANIQWFPALPKAGERFGNIKNTGLDGYREEP